MKRKKILVFKRAYFHDGFNSSLEVVLRQVAEKMSRPQDRVMPIDLFRHQALAHVEPNPYGRGVFARFFEFEEGATGLVDLASKDMSAEIEALMPPENRQFLADEIVLLISENNVIACGLSNKQGTFASLLHTLAERLGVLGEDATFKIKDVPNRTTLKQVKDVGVKTIDLSIETYLASVELIDPGSVLDRVARALFLVPSDTSNLRKRAAMSAKLHISRGHFKKAEIQKDDWVSFVGAEVIDSAYGDDYKIVLEDDTIISNENLRVMKPVEIKRHANSVSYHQTKLELSQYLVELEERGMLRW